MLGLTSWSTDINEPFLATEFANQLSALIEQRADVASQVRDRSAALGVEAWRNFDAARTWVAGTTAKAKARLSRRGA